MVRDSRLICDYRDFLEYPEKAGESLKKCSFREDYQNFSGRKEKSFVPIPVRADGQYEFCFEDVSFVYPGSQTYALKNLNLTLKPGHRLAVVGLNGAGKSTFIHLLCRLYEPTSGKIYMNGQDISEFDPEATDKERARECLEKAGMSEKLHSLPAGIDTELLKYLKQDGIELSGGEKQKMALARALYKNAPIVVLDEPTAALDALAEYRTYMDFDKLIGGKTAVYISHRLSSTRFCHAVAMFENGCMIEYGTHEELLRAGGAYARMFEVQAQYYRGAEGCANA